MYKCCQCGTMFASPVFDEYEEEVRPNKWLRFTEALCPVCSSRDFEEVEELQK